MKNISNDLRNIINKSKQTKQVGDTRIDKNGRTLVWTKTPSGYDWRKQKDNNTSSDKTTQSNNSVDKLKKFLKNTDNDKLKQFANKPKNDPKLRQFAYDELVERGIDVSDINLNTGRYGMLNSLSGNDTDNEEDLKQLKTDKGDVNRFVDDEGHIDYRNPQFIKEKFGFTDWSKATKSQRIAYDNFVHDIKTNSPDYLSPIKEIGNLNKMFITFLKTKAPLFIASGGAGVGKTYNFHLVAQYLNMKPFDPETDSPGDSDYDYVEAPEVQSVVQLAQVLKEHNGKTIVFDDADNIFRTPETMGMLKKATATSGKRIIGKKSSNANSNVDPFEFTGKIVFLTNMNQSDFTKNEDMNAVYSRADKKDIYFTKREQLFFIDKLKHKFNFTGVDRLENKADDIKERDEVYQLIADNIDKIDPAKFNSRTMKEIINIKRAEDVANEVISNDPVMASMMNIEADDWKDTARKMLIKGIYVGRKRNIEKAYDILNLDTPMEKSERILNLNDDEE